MVQLIGNVTGLGLAKLVRFLTDLQLSGQLCLTPEPGVNTGTIFLQDGHVVGATLDPQQGLPALEALVLVCGNATFTFSDSAGEIKYNLIAEPTALHEHLDHLGDEGRRLMDSIGSLTAVPRLTELAGEANESVAVTRGALRLLVDIRENSTVFELGHAYGFRPTLEHLHELIQLRLVTTGSPGTHSVTAATPGFAKFFPRLDNHHELDTPSPPIGTDPTGASGG
jgi:hypothetical protein